MSYNWKCKLSCAIMFLSSTQDKICISKLDQAKWVSLVSLPWASVSLEKPASDPNSEFLTSTFESLCMHVSFSVYLHICVYRWLCINIDVFILYFYFNFLEIYNKNFHLLLLIITCFTCNIILVHFSKSFYPMSTLCFFLSLILFC